MIKPYICILLFIFWGLHAFSQKKEYSGQMQVTPVALQQKGDSLYVKINFSVAGVNVDSRRSISLIPVLNTPKYRHEFPSVMVKGRINYKVHEREMVLMSKRAREEYDKSVPYAILKGYEANDQKSVDYDQVVKYEEWMADAKLEILEDLCGCGSFPRQMGISLLMDSVAKEKVIIVEPYEITPYLAYAQPKAEKTKQREIIGEAFLDFVVNQTIIQPDFMSNPIELKKITDLITDLRNDESITVHAINIIGYASPEGTIEGNKRLSEGRAKALVDYLVPQFDFAPGMYKVYFGGENWAGLRKLLEASSMPQAESLLEILDSTPEIDFKNNRSWKKSLKDYQGGKPYQYLLKEYFPSLRKAICKIDFEVKNFDVVQAREVVKTRPQNLSLNEFFMVAGTVEKGSQEFIDLFETAVRIFPDDQTANLNAAVAALSRGDVIYAKRYIERVADVANIPEYYNTAGVIALQEGEYDNSKMLLQKALDLGLVEAKQNLMELEKKLENIALRQKADNTLTDKN